jgi:hypothetical protein
MKAQQEQRAVREQHEDRGPTGHQGLAAPTPELIGREPSIGRDDAGGEQEAQVEVAGESGQMADDEPRHRPRDDVYRQRRPPVEHACAGPGNGEAHEQQGIGEVDRDRLGNRAVQAEQHDRTRPDQVRAAPPGDGADLRVLDPREQQQQPENRLDVDRHEEKRIDVEIHSIRHQTTVRETPRLISQRRWG